MNNTGTTPKVTKETSMFRRPADIDERAAWLYALVRLGVLVWSGSILTITYVDVPWLPKQSNVEETFIASIFTGTLATFGVQMSNANRRGQLSKDDIGRCVDEHLERRTNLNQNTK